MNKRIYLKKAFTLVEVLLVIVILLVITAVALPNFSKTYSKYLFKKKTDTLVYRMRRAQSRAVAKTTQIVLEFNADFSEYWFTQTETVQQNLNLDDNLSKRIGGIISLPSDISVDADSTKITFYPDGTIDKVNIYLCAERNGTPDGMCYTVTTKLQRGNIHILEMDK